MTVRHYCFVFLSVCLIFSTGQAVADAPIQFLYINAGEESAAGGHVALKMGDEVFHFQHVPPGLLRVRRDNYEQFRDQYADRENRTIRMHHVEVSEKTIELLRERFNRILLIEEEQFSRLETLENDRRLLTTLLQQSNQGEGQADGEKRTQLMGLGLFFQDGWNYTESTQESPSQPTQASIARLAGRVAAAYGDTFLTRKNNETLHSLKALSPVYDLPADVFSEDRFRTADYSFSERYTNHLTVLAALRVLALGLPLREGVLLRPEGADFHLNQAETQCLNNYKGLLENQLLGLLRGNHPDRGFPLLLGMARLIALDESIASGHLVFLNLAKPRGTTDEAVVVPGENQYAAYALGRSGFFTAKSVLSGAEPADEWAYSHLEKTANVYFELDQAVRKGRMARLEGMDSMPSSPASMALILPTMTAAEVQSTIEKLDNDLAKYQANMADLYAYRLIGRNCATEIFRVIGQAMQESANPNASLEGQPSQGMAKAESIRSLGGYVSGLGVEFIPFLSFRVVEDNWRISYSETVPSYRLRRLDQYKALENPLLVDLRESNVFSSSLYKRHGGDSTFVFFTDDWILARPLAGVFNLAAGLAQAVFGVLTLPWNGGENLRMGVKGALFSLPELFFVNIRKGTFPEDIQRFHVEKVTKK